MLIFRCTDSVSLPHRGVSALKSSATISLSEVTLWFRIMGGTSSDDMSYFAD